MATSRTRRRREALASRDTEKRIRIADRAERLRESAELSPEEAYVLAILKEFDRPMKLRQVQTWSILSLSATDGALVRLIEKGKATRERDFPHTEYRAK